MLISLVCILEQKDACLITCTILEKSYRTAGDIGDLWKIKMDEMHIMLRFSV